jgi:hypothetical protein
MVKLICDTCEADLTTAKEAWGVQVAEIKHNNILLTMHFCDECQAEFLMKMENVVKGIMNGTA